MHSFLSARMNPFSNGEDHSSIVIGATADIIAIFALMRYLKRKLT